MEHIKRAPIRQIDEAIRLIERQRAFICQGIYDEAEMVSTINLLTGAVR